MPARQQAEMEAAVAVVTAEQQRNAEAVRARVEPAVEVVRQRNHNVDIRRPSARIHP